MGELGTAETLDMVDRMLDQTGAELVTLSGGEPLLRADIFEIVEHLAARGATMNFISNGALLTEAAIARLIGSTDSQRHTAEGGCATQATARPDERRIGFFELPLLSVEREIHDRMSGAAGAFDRVTLAMANLKAARQRVVGVFVATRLNLPTWRETVELAVALGLDGLMFNRFNPGGRGGQHVALLQASPAEISAALDVANELSAQYGLSISCSIPMPPCLFDTARWPRLSFGFCAAGTARAYYTLDPLGNVRPCNHSPTILGNIRRTTFREMATSATMKHFMAARPQFCRGCARELECQGGCKAAAEACTGDLAGMDPFLAAYCGQAVRK